MPAKRIIILGRTQGMDTQAVLWADVPAGNQIAYADPLASSAYENATPAELQAIRNGLVAEKVAQHNYPGTGTPLTVMQTDLQAQWQAWQDEITAETKWADYGRFWDNTPAWQAATGVPMRLPSDKDDNQPTFFVLTPTVAFAASRFHFVLFNGVATPTSQRLVVRLRLLVLLVPTTAAVGALSGPWTLRRRESPTTPPSGSPVTPRSTDSSIPLNANISAFGVPGVAPAGGTAIDFVQVVPQPDELKVNTADAPTLGAVLSGWGGQVLYRAADIPKCKPLTIRANQTIELQQDATAGVGNGRILSVFTVG